MAQHQGKQGEWPRVKGNPDYGCVLHPNGKQSIDRELVGPLRMGTAPNVGPSGRAIIADESRLSDLGMDRISPRRFDPIGTSDGRAPAPEESKLIAQEIRGK
jgi:hypothetical protein